MIYRVDALPPNGMNPITGQEYDGAWMVFSLTDSAKNQAVVGRSEEGAYVIRLSRILKEEWYLSVGDFMEYCEANGLNGILVMSQQDVERAQERYIGHTYDEPVLRGDEPRVLVHSTTADGWAGIQRDGALKSWKSLSCGSVQWEEEPIGTQLGDPVEFSRYVMFGGGVSGEIVVSSRLSGFINMDVNAAYHTGARLYFDAEKMAHDGLLIRDGVHIKVRDSLPLAPYLIWAATWDRLGMESPISTPKVFAEAADSAFGAGKPFELSGKC